jgi:hypothetical protein
MLKGSKQWFWFENTVVFFFGAKVKVMSAKKRAFIIFFAKILLLPHYKYRLEGFKPSKWLIINSL